MSADDRINCGGRWAGGDFARRVRWRSAGVRSGSARRRPLRGRVWSPDLNRVEHAPVVLTAGAMIRLADALDTTVGDLLGKQWMGTLTVAQIHEPDTHTFTHAFP
jgi:hypothetical protein